MLDLNTITQSAFAALVGVDKSAVHRAIQSGRLPATGEEGAPARQVRFDPALGAEAAKALWNDTASPMPHHQARKDQIDGAKAQGEVIPDAEKLAAALKLETYKLQKAKAERENMALDKEAGLLVERAEVDLLVADLGATSRVIHERFPERWAHEWTALGVPADRAARLLEEMGRETSQELAEHIHRNMEQLT